MSKTRIDAAHAKGTGSAGEMPHYLPTPAEIEAECAKFREFYIQRHLLQGQGTAMQSGRRAAVATTRSAPTGSPSLN